MCSDIQRVLREDREKLRLLQKNQPRFSEQQKKELIEVHPWIKKGGLPEAIDIKVIGWFICVDLDVSYHLSLYHLTVCAVQVCSCCNSTSEAAAEVVAYQPDVEVGDAETWNVGIQRMTREEPTNTSVIS